MLRLRCHGLGTAAAALALWTGRHSRPCAAEDAAPQAAFLRRASSPPGAPALYARRWVPSASADLRAAGPRLRVAQFNVLADGLSGKDKNLGGFTEAPAASLEWRYRAERLVEELLRHGELPDIIALEEVDHYHDWFEPVLSELGYEGTFLAKLNSPCKRSLDPQLSDGCALFWRREAVSLVELEALSYDSEGPDGLPTGGKDNQVAILARLRPHGGAPLTLAVTHLAAKKTAEGEHLRARQIRQLLSRIEELHLPCVVAADLNATPNRGATSDYESEAYPLALQHTLGLRSAYAEVLGAEPAFTTWKKRGSREAVHTIDYIFVSPGIEVVRVLGLPEPEDVDIARLPGWRYPSDHFALMAELRVPGAGARL